MNWYLKAFKQYADFSGRATRSEYWYFILFYSILVIIASFVDTLLSGQDNTFPVVTMIVILVHIMPSLAVSVRRLHDIGKSGWWYLISLIPVIGPIILIIFAVLDSDQDNQYGPNPKAL